MIPAVPTLEELLDAPVEVAGAFGITVQLLNHLRLNSRAFRGLPNPSEDVGEAVDEWIGRFASGLGNLDSDPSRLAGAEVDALLGDVEPPDVPDLRIVHALAMALDEAHGGRFYHDAIEWYAARDGTAGRGPLGVRFAVHARAGDPVPISAERRVRVRGSSRSTEGALPYEERPDRVPHLTVVPELPGDAELIVDFRLHDAIDNFETAVVATGHPTTRMRDFALESFPMGPADPAATESVLLAALRVAREQKAQLLILPELVSTPEIRARLVAGWSALGGEAPLVLIPGTEHVRDGTQRCNVASVVTMADADEFVDGPSSWFAHKKFRPTTSWVSKMPTRTRRQTEELDYQPVSLRVHATSGLKIAVLICRDFLESEARRLVEAAEIDVLVIPALAAKLDAFHDPAAELATQYMTEVFVVNGMRSVRRRGPGAFGFVAHPGPTEPVIDLGAPRRRGVTMIMAVGEDPIVRWVALEDEG
jgi:hypothetical protein